jgi:mRNA interferase MazF
VARAELYASKVRPVLVIQADGFDVHGSIVTRLLTTFDAENGAARVRIEPDDANGLGEASSVMTDKVFSLDKADLAKRIGALQETDMSRVADRLRGSRSLTAGARWG